MHHYITMYTKVVHIMNIGRKIKERRTELKISQRELADKMGYSNHSTITRIEAGKVDIPQSKIAKFAEVLNTTPAVLMGWNEKIEENPIEEANKWVDWYMNISMCEENVVMFEEFIELDEAKKKQVREFVHFLSGRL